ncbi:MAG: OmpP1/FadL family transporter [Roseibacillus sp.]
MTPSLLGAGFQLAERSASGLGRAFSGEAAIADDASVVASNPAAMIMLGGEWNFSAGITYIDPGANATLYPALTGGNGGPALKDDDIAESAWVPYVYGTKRINDKVAVGAGLFSTFGLRTNYETSTAALVATDYSEITTVNFNPSIAYRINDQLTLGAGFNVMYAEGEITSLAPGGMGARLFGLEGDDIAFGYNIGFLYELSERTRIGLHYRSSMKLELEGDVTLSPAFNTLVPGGVFDVDGVYDGTLDVELPATVELSLYHEVNDKWAFHGDILWTQWSSFETLEPKTGVVNANPFAPVPVDPILATPENWNDAFRYSIGATYQHNDSWTFRTGIAYDESPVDDEFRTLRIPDGDRIWLSLGASYAVTENMKIDAGYSFVMVDEVSLGENDGGFIGTDSIGEGNIHLFALGMSGSF